MRPLLIPLLSIALAAVAPAASNWAILPVGTGLPWSGGPPVTPPGSDLPPSQRLVTIDDETLGPPWAPEASQVEEAEAALERFLVQQGRPRQARELSKTLRQYVGFLRGGRRLLYLNAFPTHDRDVLACVGEPRQAERIRKNCEEPDFWRKVLLTSDGGGDACWHAEYDLAAHRFGALRLNPAKSKLTEHYHLTGRDDPKP